MTARRFHRRPRRASVRDGGAATVLVIGCVVLLGVLAAGWLTVTRAAFARQRAETAADLAVLAAAAAVQRGQPGCGVAGEVAARNGGRLMSCGVAGDAVAVRVQVGGAITATAQARAGPEGS